MWTQYSIGEARWQSAGWTLRIANDAQGIKLRVSYAQTDEAEGIISLGGDPMPPANEMFVRGDELHLHLPQHLDEGSNTAEAADRVARNSIAGLEVVFTPIVNEAGLFVVESTLSLQTQWLDVHPRLSIELPGAGAFKTLSNHSAVVFSPELLTNSPNTETEPRTPWAMLLVEERDRLSLAALDESDRSIRFFDEFMEKGVIRKIQPWWVWILSPLSERRVAALCEDLARRPLPLAS